MAVTASMIKELRGNTGAGMLDCKKALEASDGDIAKAQVWLREKGMAKADAKSSRATGEGVIAIASDAQAVAMVEINCETDFVARDDNMTAFVEAISQQALTEKPASLDALLASERNSQTIEAMRAGLVAKVGENIQVRRVELLEAADGGLVASYQHGQRIGVAVSLSGGGEALGRDIAMHVAARDPLALDADSVDPALIEQEKAIYQTQAQDSGKPADIIEKMTAGKLNKFLAGNTLLGQAFVKDPDLSIAQLLEKHGATLHGYVRFEVGQGIASDDVEA